MLENRESLECETELYLWDIKCGAASLDDVQCLPDDMLFVIGGEGFFAADHDDQLPKGGKLDQLTEVVSVIEAVFYCEA